MELHNEVSPLAKIRVMVVADPRLHNHELHEAEILIEDWFDRINGGQSWMISNGNPAALMYAMRSGLGNLPLDDEVLYGKDFRGMGHLIHVNEIKGVGITVNKLQAIPAKEF